MQLTDTDGRGVSSKPIAPKVRVIENHKPIGPDNEEINTCLSKDNMSVLTIGVCIIACSVTFVFGVIIGVDL